MSYDIYQNPPLGYVDSPEARAEVTASFAASGVDVSPASFSGAFQRMIDSGIHYLNLHDFEADFIRGQGESLIKSGRKVMDCGILEPLDQQTGICSGCSHSLSPWLSWCARYVLSGDCPTPREVTFVGGYLLGRARLRGDSGAYPNYTAKGYYELGVLTVDVGGKYKFREMNQYQQEDVCIALRDNALILPEWLDGMTPLKTACYTTSSTDAVADSIASFCAPTFGMSLQNNPAPNPGGISSLYRLNGGHETCGSGIATLRGRKILLKSESWFGMNKFPGGAFPGGRVIINTDDGPKTLYPGQGAMWLDEWMSGRPEVWAYSWPGSAA